MKSSLVVFLHQRSYLIEWTFGWIVIKKLANVDVHSKREQTSETEPKFSLKGFKVRRSKHTKKPRGFDSTYSTDIHNQSFDKSKNMLQVTTRKLDIVKQMVIQFTLLRTLFMASQSWVLRNQLLLKPLLLQAMIFRYEYSKCSTLISNTEWHNQKIFKHM